MRLELDEHDLKLIHTALCYFDMYEDGNYDKWFGKDRDKINNSFLRLYSLSQTIGRYPVQ